MKIRETICDDCPFRRKAPAGWLGANQPLPFALHAIDSDLSSACHKMMDQTLPREKWLQAEMSAPRCRGAVILQRNTCKLSRNREMAALTLSVEPDTVTVFSNVQEFVNHHLSAKVRSWEL